MDQIKTFTAHEIAELAQPIAAALVCRVERVTRSRMKSYENVAAMIGVSQSWLRKLIGRQEVSIEAHEYINLINAFNAGIIMLDDDDVRRVAFLHEASSAAASTEIFSGDRR